MAPTDSPASLAPLEIPALEPLDPGGKTSLVEPQGGEERDRVALSEDVVNTVDTTEERDADIPDRFRGQQMLGEFTE
jgi:hypothetical protein